MTKSSQTDTSHAPEPARSEVVVQLERDFGAPLLESQRKSTLSNDGHVTLEEARGALAHYERERVTITTFAADRRCDVARAPSRFDIHVNDSDSSAIVDAAETRVDEVGLCVLADKRQVLSFEALFREPLDFDCSVDRPPAKTKAPLKWAQLEGRCLILNGSASTLAWPEVSHLAANSELTAACSRPRRNCWPASANSRTDAQRRLAMRRSDRRSGFEEARRE
jgi:LysR family transcriptional regulator, carnitine catabolism transcriptional activator